MSHSAHDQNDDHDGLVLDDEESRELREIFSTIFPQYLVPLEELIGQLLDGRSSPTIVEGLRGAVNPLLAAADRVGVKQLEQVLREFQSVVERVAEKPELDETARSGVIDVFYRLKEAVHALAMPPPGVPPATSPSLARKRSDFVERVTAVEGVGPAEVQQLLAAGINSAAQVAQATVDEIAAVTGFSRELAAQIHETFGGRKRVQSATSSAERAGDTATGDAEEESAAANAARDAGLTLLGLVHERVRLAGQLRHERALCVEVNRRMEEQRRAASAVEREVSHQEETLAYERELTRRADAQCAAVAGELDRVRGAAQGDDGTQRTQLEEVRQRLNEIRRRIDTGFGPRARERG